MDGEVGWMARLDGWRTFRYLRGREGTKEKHDLGTWEMVMRYLGRFSQDFVDFCNLLDVW